MATENQIAANRENAKKSTGPRTAKGRNKIRANAVKHNLTGQILTLSESERPVFGELQTELLTDLKPANALERQLATGIAWDTWRLNRLRAIESNTFTGGREDDIDEYGKAMADARTFRDEVTHLDLLSLYELRITRNLHRNTSLLRGMQNERKRLCEADKKEEVLLNYMNEINNIEIQASEAPLPKWLRFFR